MMAYQGSELVTRAKEVGVGVIAPSPGRRTGESGHVATRMIVEILAHYHDNINIFTRDTFSDDLDAWQCVHLIRIRKPLADTVFAKLGLSFILYQARIATEVLKRRRELGIVILGGWGLILPLVVCRLTGIVAVQRIGGHPQHVLRHKLSSRAVTTTLKLTAARAVEWLGYRLAHYIAVISPEMIAFNDLDRLRSKVVIWDHYCLDSDEFSVLVDFHERDNFVGFVGMINDDKGVPELIEAVPRVLDEVPDAKFVLIGTGPALDMIRERVVELDLQDHVQAFGYVDRSQIPELLNRMRFLILPSKHEGVPKVVLEAMACGTIPIASKVGGVTDLITEGQNGFLLSSIVPHYLSQKLVSILELSDLSVVSGRARQTIEHNYSLEAAVEKYRLSILEPVLGSEYV